MFRELHNYYPVHRQLYYHGLLIRSTYYATRRFIFYYGMSLNRRNLIVSIYILIGGNNCSDLLLLYSCDVEVQGEAKGPSSQILSYREFR